MLVVFRAWPLRTLRSLQMTVYNLGDVVADVHRTVTLEDVTALISSHRFPHALPTRHR